MALTEKQIQHIAKAGEDFLQKHRPPPEIRPKLDLSYRIIAQSLEVFEIRPCWDNPYLSSELSVAKATFVATRNHWKVFWMRANLKWHNFTPTPTVETTGGFFELIGEDITGCFFG